MADYDSLLSDASQLPVDARIQLIEALWGYGSCRLRSNAQLKQRLNEANQPFAVTIITVEEVMRGWMAAIRRTKDPFRQINAYAKLRQLFRSFATWGVVDWTTASAAKFAALKSAKVRVGTMDLKLRA